jgi:HSP20 family protein
MAVPARYEPERELFPVMSSFRRDLDRLFGDFFGSMMRPETSSMMNAPMMELNETERGFELEAEMPGIRPEELKIEVAGNMLTIQARQQREEKGERGRSRERRSFYRALTLPATIDASKIDARLENGLLTIALPRSEQAKPREIQVQGGAKTQQQQPKIEKPKGEEGKKVA